MQQLHTSSSAAFPQEQETGGRAAQDGHVRLQHGNRGWERLRQSAEHQAVRMLSAKRGKGCGYTHRKHHAAPTASPALKPLIRCSA